MKTTITAILILLSAILISLYIIDYKSGAFRKGVRKMITGVAKTDEVVSKTVKAPLYRPTIQKNVGEKFTLWDMEYTVQSAEDKGSSYEYNTTSGKYIFLKIKATNVGKVENGLNNIYIQDSKGRQYKQNKLIMDFSSGLNPYGITRNYSSGIAAGLSESFYAIFEVPKDSTDLKLEYPSAQGPVVLSVKLGL